MSNRPKTILLPNVTSPRNIGDVAILSSLVALLRSVNKNTRIIGQGGYPILHAKGKLLDDVTPNLYDWVLYQHNNVLVRLYRLTVLLITLLLLKFNISLSKVDRRLSQIIEKFQTADLVVFVAGGSLRSKKGFTQHVNLFLVCADYLLASITKKLVLVTPISFGPFAYRIHEKFAARVLSAARVIGVREKISYDCLRKYKHPNVILSTDLALFAQAGKTHGKKEKLIGFTIRPWHEEARQNELEHVYADALAEFSVRQDIAIQPIVQVYEPSFPKENDYPPTLRVYQHIKKSGAKVLEPVILRNLDHAVSVYSKLQLLVGMRMHSNILAATQGVPYVSISYEHKTEGLSQALGLSEYCLKSDSVDSQSLRKTIDTAFINRVKIQKVMMKKIDLIRLRETKRWKKMFAHYLR